MPYLDVFVDADQFDKAIVEELDFALSEDRDLDRDQELRRAMILVRNYFADPKDFLE